MTAALQVPLGPALALLLALLLAWVQAAAATEPARLAPYRYNPPSASPSIVEQEGSAAYRSRLQGEVFRRERLSPQTGAEGLQELNRIRGELFRMQGSSKGR